MGQREQADERGGVLLPAAMKLLGDWNWYLPKRVERVLERTRTHRTAEAGAE